MSTAGEASCQWTEGRGNHRRLCRGLWTQIEHGSADGLPAYSAVKRQSVSCVSSPACTCYLCFSPMYPGLNITPRLHKPQCPLLWQKHPFGSILDQALSENTNSFIPWGCIKTKILNPKQTNKQNMLFLSHIIQNKKLTLSHNLIKYNSKQKVLL